MNVRVTASQLAVSTAREGGLLIVHDPLVAGSAATRGRPSPSTSVVVGGGLPPGNCAPQPSPPTSANATANFLPPNVIETSSAAPEYSAHQRGASQLSN